MTLKSPKEISIMREGGELLAGILRRLTDEAQDGVTLQQLDKLARELIKEVGGEPAFLGYRPHGAKKSYPAAICTSLNEVVVHGVPTNRKLQSGDILKIDLGLKYKRFYTDTAITVGIGKIFPAAEKLITVCREALSLAIKNCRPDKRLGDLGAVVSRFVKLHKFSVIKGLCGHGVGKELHEAPIVPNEGRPNTGLKLLPGMVLAIEPMISAGSPYIIQLPDESYATSDGSLSAQFEHTVAITENGCQILT